MATSQVARYLHCPCCSHKLALEHIGRYLKGTTDKGVILCPTKFDESFNINVYVYAAFACSRSVELGTNPKSVNSRACFIIEVLGCPILLVVTL